MAADQPFKTEPRARYDGMVTRSHRWMRFARRPGDVIVSTPPKSGTTWLQAILALLFSGDPEVDANPSVNAPWIDNRMRDLDDMLAHLEGMPGRRQVKTHTPLDGIPLWPDVYYISVYRHPIDVHFSARKHVANYRPDVAAFLGVTEETFPSDPRASFSRFLTAEDLDHGSLHTIVAHYLRSLDVADQDNVLCLHYADMMRDLPGAFARIAAHVGAAPPDQVVPSLIEAARFDNMKANADRFGLAAGAGFWRSDSGFFDSASSNKWEGVLTGDDLAAYDQALSALLSADQRAWLEWGGSVEPLPQLS